MQNSQIFPHVNKYQCVQFITPVFLKLKNKLFKYWLPTLSCYIENLEDSSTDHRHFVEIGSSLYLTALRAMPCSNAGVSSPSIHHYLWLEYSWNVWPSNLLCKPHKLPLEPLRFRTTKNFLSCFLKKKKSKQPAGSSGPIQQTHYKAPCSEECSLRSFTICCCSSSFDRIS